MTKEECFELGIISKTFSFKGEVILFIDSDQPDHYYDIDMMLLEINGQLVPYFVEKSSVHKTNQLRILFDNIRDEADAKRITKKKVYLPLAALPDLKDDQFYYHEIIGFTLIDQEENEVGEILNLIENPANSLLEVQYGNNEALIPFNDQAFMKVDKKLKTLQVRIPEGLLDIYE